MEEQIQQPDIAPVEPQHQIVVGGKRSFRPFLKTVLVILLICGAAYGAYFWQHKKLDSSAAKISSLQSELTSSQSQVSKLASTKSQSTTAGTFTYTPGLGDLVLKLPKSYGILVGADGNDGGAAGLTFKVISINDTNIYSDAYYTREVEINIVGSTENLSDYLSTAETNIKNATDCNALYTCDITKTTVTDSTIDGLPAKLITADEGEYNGTVSIYVVASGNWGYQISAGGLDGTAPTALLSAVLKGISFK